MNKKFCLTKLPQGLAKFSFSLLSSMVFFGAHPQAIALEINSTVHHHLLQLEIPELPSLGDPEIYLYDGSDIFEVQVVIRLSKRRVYVYQEEQEIASYPIAVGKKGWETPQGNFAIIQMIEAPSWQNPWTGKVIPAGPNNPLGERWIGFWSDGKNTIGFHGTPGEHLIGQAVSHGCVRMKNKDIKALFDLVAIGTTVTVKP
jgi:hypothetical protein